MLTLLDIVYSFTESPYFDDLYYVGEIKKVSIVELKKQFPNITDEEIKEYRRKWIGSGHYYIINLMGH